MPDFRLAYRPFPEQQAFFRRKLSVPSARWDDLKLGDHAHGFMVAGVAREAVLADIRAAIEAAITNGETLADFRKRFNQVIASHGWPGGAGNESAARRAWRTRVIYQTNLRTSYMAGRWEHLKTFPFLRYQHNAVANPREQHLAWDGVVLATDNPWWDTHYTPNGWGCRCTITGVSRARLAQLGKTEPDPTPAPITGDPPPEWAYHVGKAARSLPAAASFGQKVMALPPAWRAVALQDAQQRGVAWFADWPEVVRRADREIRAGAARGQGITAPLGFLSESVVDHMHLGRSLNQKTFTPVPVSNALIATIDHTMYHALRDAKLAGRPALRDVFIDGLQKLPQHLRDADAVLWDATGRRPALLFARRRDDGYLVLVVRLNYLEKSIRAAWLRTIEVRTLSELQPLPLLSGALE